MYKYELPRTYSRLSKVIVWQTDRQTDRQTWPKLYMTPLRGWSNMVVCVFWLRENLENLRNDLDAILFFSGKKCKRDLLVEKSFWFCIRRSTLEPCTGRKFTARPGPARRDSGPARPGPFSISNFQARPGPAWPDPTRFVPEMLNRQSISDCLVPI